MDLLDPRHPIGWHGQEEVDLGAERLTSRTGPLWTAFHLIAREEPESLADWAAKPPS